MISPFSSKNQLRSLDLGTNYLSFLHCLFFFGLPFLLRTRPMTEWNANAGQQSAQQIWNSSYQQPYAPPAYPYSHVAAGYAPHVHAGYTGAYPPPMYPPPSYAGYAPYAGAAAHAGSDPKYQASSPYLPVYQSPTAAPPSYGMQGPPTKKRLTSESQLSSAPYHGTPSYSATTPNMSYSGSNAYAAPHAASKSHPHQYVPPSSNTTTSSSASSPGDWPPSLRQFVERCYEQTPKQDQPELEKKLFEMIKLAEQSNTLWTRDWAKMAVPVTSSQKSAPSKQPTTWASVTTGGNFKYGAQEQHLSKKDKQRSKKQREEEEEEESRRVSRASRFQSKGSSGTNAKQSGYNASTPSPWAYGGYIEVSSYEDTEPIVGTSTDLEKTYLRLTERPVPSTVRPLSILKQSLELMRDKHRAGASWKEYLSSQMQSIRQDIIIQAIADEFALEVYETNARWSLENDDIAEFKRCMLRLDEFYNHLDFTSEHQDEFSCYALLFHLLPEDFPSLNSELAALAHGRKTLSDALKHSVRICEAYIDNNWTLFFHLAQKTHFLEKHLLDPAAERLRINSLMTIFVSYVSPSKTPTLPSLVSFSILTFLFFLLDTDQTSPSSGLVLKLAFNLEPTPSNGSPLTTASSPPNPKTSLIPRSLSRAFWLGRFRTSPENEFSPPHQERFAMARTASHHP